MNLTDLTYRRVRCLLACALACVLACASVALCTQSATAATGYQTAVHVSVFVVDSRDGGTGDPTHRPIEDGGAGDEGAAGDRRVTGSTQVGIFIGDSSSVAEGPAGGAASTTQTLGIRLTDAMHGSQEGTARVEWALDGPDVTHGATVEGARWDPPAADDDMQANVIGDYADAGTHPVPPADMAPASDTHDFAGWVLNGDTSKLYVAEGADGTATFPLSAIDLAEGVTYRFDAAWSGKWKNVVLDADGGTVSGFGDGAGGVYTGRFQYGTTLTLPDSDAVQRTGAVFLGWTADGVEGYVTEATWDGPDAFVAAWSPVLSCQVPTAVLLNVKVEGSTVDVGHALAADGQPLQYAFTSNSIQPVYVTDVHESTADFTHDPVDGETTADDGLVHLTKDDRAQNLATIFRGSSLADVRLTISDAPPAADGTPQGTVYRYGLHDGRLMDASGCLMVPAIGQADGRLPVYFGLSGFKPAEVSATNLKYLTVGFLEYTISFEEPDMTAEESARNEFDG